MNRKLLWTIARSGLLHREIAELIGVNKSAVSRWISGVSRPKGENMRKLMIVLHAQTPEEIGYRYVSTRESKTTSHYALLT